MSKANTPVDVFKSIDMHDGDKDVCWEWTGSLNKKDGRPYFTANKTRRPSYSWVLQLYSGEYEEGKVVRHSCDNPICCNPHHLSWGTNQDNSNDMMDRDRHGLPRTVVRAIHRLLNDGRTHASIAELYGISRETVSAINQGRSHKEDRGIG
jgi:hypothetical protein